MIRYVLACLMLAAPTAAFAQSGGQPPVAVEIVANGEVTVPAQRFRISIGISAKGKGEEAAKAALIAERAKVVQSLAAIGVREADETQSPGGSSLMAIFASMAGRSKPKVTTDLVLEETTSDAASTTESEPQSLASEKIQFDAPTRAAAAEARKKVETAGHTMEDEVIGLLSDYPAAARSAKLDALAKARVQARAYGEALGLPQAVVVKISEKQDVMGGTIGFISEIVGMFAPKNGTESNDVTVRQSLTIEFQLKR